MSKAQKDAIKKMPNSAYKSMRLSNLGLSKPTNKNNKDSLINWKKEDWINLTALLTDKQSLPCGTRGKIQQQKGLPSVCRPSKKVSEKTPRPLASQLSNKQIEKAISIKKLGNRIDWSLI